MPRSHTLNILMRPSDAKHHPQIARRAVRRNRKEVLPNTAIKLASPPATNHFFVVYILSSFHCIHSALCETSLDWYSRHINDNRSPRRLCRQLCRLFYSSLARLKPFPDACRRTCFRKRHLVSSNPAYPFLPFSNLYFDCL